MQAQINQCSVRRLFNFLRHSYSLEQEMKKLQRQEDLLREMKQLGEKYSLTYVGFYDNSYLWHSDIAPDCPHKQVYWRNEGNTEHFTSASRTSLQQRENSCIRDLESLESLNLICASITKDLKYVGVGKADTGKMIKGYPPLTNERKDALWKIEDRIFESSVTVMMEWSNLIKKLNTGMLAFKLVGIDEKLLSEKPNTVRCEFVGEETLLATHASVQQLMNAVGKEVQGQSIEFIRASEYIRQGLQSAGKLLYLGCGENINAIDIQRLPNPFRYQQQAWWYDCLNGCIVNPSLKNLVENGWVSSKALQLSIVKELARSIHPSLKYISGYQENGKKQVMRFRIQEALMTGPVINLTEEQLVLRAHCDDVARTAFNTSRKRKFAFIGGVCDAEAQKLIFDENGRLDTSHLLKTLLSNETLQSFFAPPEHNHDKEKGKWLLDNGNILQKSLVEMNELFCNYRLRQLVSTKGKVHITVEDFQKLAEKNSLAYLGRPTSYKKMCSAAPSLEHWLLHKDEPIILQSVLADEFDNEYVPWTYDSTCLETEVWWQHTAVRESLFCFF